MREEIAETCGRADAAAFEAFVDWLRRLYAIELPQFIDRNYDSPLGLLASPIALAELVRLGAFGRLGAAVRRRFRDPRLHRLFSFQAMYAGLAPDKALALYAVITYMDSIAGLVPEGGIHAVPVAMALAAEKAGATFRYGDPVERCSGRRPVARLASGFPPAASFGPMRWSARSTCRWPTRPCWPTSCPQAGLPATPPRPWSGMWALKGRRRRVLLTTTSTSEPNGIRRSPRCSATGS